MGYVNTKVLGGGVEAWKKAGYPLIPAKGKLSRLFLLRGGGSNVDYFCGGSKA
jgi:hypothetical protein